MRPKPELVAPAGNLEKLKTAIDFGADAVYLGGQNFSLRAMADNFILEDMVLGVEYAHDRGRKVYVTVNIFAHNRDIEQLPDYLNQLERLRVDGLIVSDPGVLLLVREYAPNLPITISTQANVTNYLSADFYRRQGASRVVLARELSIQEIAVIRQKIDIDLEVFVHGAMCLSYSGRCWLSQAMTGRSANQGKCAHPCRYRYVLQEEKRPGEFFPVEEDDRGTYVMNSKDLCMIGDLSALTRAGVDSFKIEGRMKSPYYVASVVKVYREAIDAIVAGGDLEQEKWMNQLERVATRPFTAGFAHGNPDDAQDLSRTLIPRQVLFCGVVRGGDPQMGRLLIEQRAPFRVGNTLEILTPGQKISLLTVGEIFNADGDSVDVARHPQEMVWIECEKQYPPGTLLGKVADE